MSKKWTKSSDWIPLSNAIAQVAFWKQDLLYAENFYDYIQNFKNLPGYSEINKQAEEDITESREGLRKARLKLAESQTLQ